MDNTDTTQDKKSFLERHPWVLPVVLGLYVFLLAVGTIGEVFDIKWITDLPIYKGP